MCSSANIVISVMPNGRISSIVKMGYGSLQPTTLSKTLEVKKVFPILHYMFVMYVLIITFYEITDGNKGRNKIK